MAKLTYGRKASNNPIVRIFVLDSSKTDGSGLTGLSSSSSGLVINIIRELDSSPTLYSQAGSTIEAVTTIGTYAAPSATKCRFKAVDGTNLPGWYEIQFAQALFGTGDGSRFVGGMAFGATNMAPCPFEIQLDPLDPGDVNLVSILGTALTETAGQIAAGFKKFFNIASPAATMDHLVLVDTATAVTNRVTANADQIEGSDATDQIRDAILDDATRFHGARIDAAVTSRAVAGDAMALTSGERTTLAGVIWNTLTSALTTVGSIGKLLVDNVNATISSRSSHSAADVWAVATRLLTAGTNIVLAKGVGVTGFNDLDAAGVRGAVGLASANLDTQLSALLASIGALNDLSDSDVQTDAFLALVAYDAATGGEVTTAVTTLSAILALIQARTDPLPPDPLGYSGARALADHYERTYSRRQIERGVTRIGAERVLLAAAAGKISGATGDAGEDFMRIADVHDRVDRIEGTSDQFGNRDTSTIDTSPVED